MYELTSDMQIVRTGTPPVQQVMEQLIPATGDEELDGLLQHAKLKLRELRQEDPRVSGDLPVFWFGVSGYFLWLV
ncbi:UNVERIFIED_ORG: hypothetical protein ABIB19_003623, partial [Arthrobacter sp. UYEF10]